MSYTITAENLVGAVVLHRDSAEAAAKKARELEDDGMWNVRVDGDDPASDTLTQAPTPH